MAKKKSDAGTVKVRILVDTHLNGEALRCNEVKELSANAAAELVKSGAADDNLEAVKAAEAA